MSTSRTFLAVFIGSKTSQKTVDWNALSDSERQKKNQDGIAAWKAWVEKHHADMVYLGGPLGKAKEVSLRGIGDISNTMGAFTVVTADSHEAAAKLFENHPHFTHFPGECVEVMPVLPIPGPDHSEKPQRNDVMKITVETLVAAPIDQVWRAYTNPDDIEQWNAASDDWHTTAARVDLREGGTFSSRMEAKDGSMGFDFTGTYMNIIPPKLLEYRFGDRTARVEFAEVSGRVNVRVTFDAETTHSIEQQRDGWQSILDNFSRYVESSQREDLS